MIQAFYEKWKNGDLSVLTVNLDRPEANIAQFMGGRKLSFPVLLDPQQAVCRLYQVRYIPVTFFIDRNGVVRDMVIGAFESVEDIEVRVERITTSN